MKTNGKENGVMENGMKTEELEAREKELNRRELRVEALEALSQRGLSHELVELIDLDSRESCMAAIERLDGAVRSEVRRHVDGRLAESRVSLPGTGARNEDEMTDREYYAYRAARRGMLGM